MDTSTIELIQPRNGENITIACNLILVVSFRSKEDSSDMNKNVLLSVWDPLRKLPKAGEFTADIYF